MLSKFKTLKTDHVNPDGLEIVIDWGNFPIGSSIFIPAINTTLLIKEMNRIARDKGMQLESRILIDGGKWGVRFWRMM